MNGDTGELLSSLASLVCANESGCDGRPNKKKTAKAKRLAANMIDTRNFEVIFCSLPEIKNTLANYLNLPDKHQIGATAESFLTYER